MLSFEEFKATKNREKTKEVRQDDKKKNSSNNNSKTRKNNHKNNETNKSETIGSRFGSFLEMTELQVFIIVMILLDTFVSFLETYMLLISHETAAITASTPIPNQAEQQHFTNSHAFKISFMVLTTFTGFSLYLFALEILAVIIVFHVAVISHFGYMMDSLIIAIQLYCEMLHIGKIGRFLNILRLWRIIRLINKLVDYEKEAHQVTQDTLTAQQIDITQYQIEIKQGQNEILKEKAARNAVEDMMKGYKEEVDTLNEALKIAAMDIAEVGGGGSGGLYDDEDSDDDNDEEKEIDGTGKALNSKSVTETNINNNNNNIYSNILNDVVEAKTTDDGDDTNLDITTAAGRNSFINSINSNNNSNDNNNNSNSTSNDSHNASFVINEDGSYRRNK